MGPRNQCDNNVPQIFARPLRRSVNQWMDGWYESLAQ